MTHPTDTAKSDELKACPFCGKHLHGPHYKEGPVAYWMHPGVVTDGECLFSGQGFYAHQLAAWNRRSSPPQNDAGVEGPTCDEQLQRAREIYWQYMEEVAAAKGDSVALGEREKCLRGDLDHQHGVQIALRALMARTPMSELQALGQEFEAGWRPIETMKLWEVGVVSDGEQACVSQKAQGDFDEGDEHYFAIDPEDALEWQPTHWLPLPSAPSGEG